jgi:signal transduction histidine kinase
MMDRLKNTVAPSAGRMQHVLTHAADKSGWRQITGPLFRKYVALFLAVVTVLLLSNGLVEIWFTYQDNKAKLISLQREKAIGAADKISEFITGIESQVGWTTQLPWSAGTIDQRRFDGLRLLRQVAAITELAQLDSAGIEQLKVSRLAMDVVASKQDYSQDPKFSEAVAKKVYYGSVYFRRESEPYMTLSLAGTRRDAGVSVAEVNLKLIQEVINAIKFGKEGQAFVIDAEGRLIAHPDISLVLRNTDMTKLAQVKAARAAGAGAETEQMQEAVNVKNQQVFTAFAAVPKLGWLVFVEIPSEEAYAPLYESIYHSSWLLLGGFLLALLSGIFLARKMVGPIQKLGTGAQRIASGDLTQRISIKTGDELEGLADQFNDMAAKLEESYAGLEQKVEQRTHELSETLDQQTATAEVLRVISSSPGELKPVFETMLANAKRICEANFGNLLLRDGDIFRVAAIHGDPDNGYSQFWQQNPNIVLRDNPGVPLARLVETKGVVHIPDLTLEQAYLDRNPRMVALVEAARARTFLSVPMLKEGELIGTITIYRQEVRPFTDKQIALVTSFANQAVIAIENVRLLNELRARTDDLTESLEQQTATSEVLGVISSSPGELEPVFQTMLSNATSLCEANFGILYRYENGGFHAAALRGVPEKFSEFLQPGPVGPGPLQRLIDDKKTIAIADITAEPSFAGDPLRTATIELGGARSLLSVPMLKESELVGAIVIYRQEVRPFTDKQIALVTSFANQAVIAIENVRLLNELRSRTDELAQSVGELRALGEVGQMVNSTLDLEVVLNTIVAKAVQLSTTDAGAIYAYDEDRREFQLRATYGMDDAMIAAIKDRHIRLGDAGIGQAAQRREPVQVADLQDEPPNPTLDVVLRAGFRALLILPLVGAEGIVGALVVRRRVPGEFAKSTVDLLQTFAAQSVVAIQNARLFSEIGEKGHQLEVASQHKSQFLANMSHELRTPLNAILGYTELILDNIYGETPGKMRGVLDRVQANGKHLLGLINDVLDLSKIEAGQLELSLSDYSIRDVVHNVFAAVESLANNKQLALKVDLPQELPPGHGDERRLTQVLLNLVGNAIKFTDVGEVAIKAMATNGAYTVSVRDTGPGISEADQAKIFEEFQQADSSATKKKGGTGLGLSIARRIVEMHGGRIWVESAIGAGATFFVTVPVMVEQQVGQAGHVGHA